MNTQREKLNHEKVVITTIASEGAELPSYASFGASGADVKAFIPEDITLTPGSSCLIPTGLHFEIPHGYEIQVRPRSGLALKNQISVLNTPGTIDADYRGEVGIILMNFGKQPFVITKGMRIAQLVLVPVFQASFCPTSKLSATVRGSSGFGHTGTV